MSWSWVSRALVAAAVGLLTTGVAGASAQEDVSGADNLAVIEPDATEAALERANRISEQLFTYDYTDLEAHEDRYKKVTTGELADEYDKLFGEIEEQAVSQQYTLSSEVVESAVRSLTKDSAQVLVYLDQTGSTSAGKNTNAGTMFLMSLRRVDGEWLAAELDAFGADR